MSEAYVRAGDGSGSEGIMFLKEIAYAGMLMKLS